MNTPFIAPIILVAVVVAFIAARRLRSSSRSPAVRHLAAGLMILVTSVPLGIAVTLYMMPLWRWVEQRYGIESVGHSGPAGWCYVATYLACVLAFSLVYAILVSRARRR